MAVGHSPLKRNLRKGCSRKADSVGIRWDGRWLCTEWRRAMLSEFLAVSSWEELKVDKIRLRVQRVVRAKSLMMRKVLLVLVLVLMV